MALSDYTENLILDTLFGKNDTYANGSSALDKNTLYIALYTSAPTDAGGGNEVSASGTGYSRLAVGNNAGESPAKWASAVGGVKKNAAELTIGGSGASADWGTITHVGILDNASGGNLIAYGPLTSSKTVNSGDIFKFAVNDLSITLD